MDHIVVKAVPFRRGAWRAEWDTEASVIVSHIVIHKICGVEVSLLPGSYKSARLLGCQEAF